MSYFEIVVNSAKKLKENPKLAVPALILFVVTALLQTAMFKFSKYKELSEMVKNVVRSNVAPSLISEKFQLELFTNFFQTHWVNLLTSTALVFIVTFAVGVGAMLWQFVMIKNLVSNKKISLWTDWRGKRAYFWSVVFIRIFMYVVSFLALVIIGVMTFFIYATMKQTFLTVTLGTITALLTLFFLILIKFGFLFRYAVLFLGKTLNPVMVIKDTFSFFKNNPAHTFYTWVSTLFVSIVIGIISLLLEYINGLLSKAGLPQLLFFVIPFLIFLLTLFYQVWLDIFLFYCYKEKA